MEDAAKALPWYRFYYRDYLTSEIVGQMDPSEHGCLNAMLHQEAVSESLPTDLELVARLIRFRPQDVRSAWKKGRLPRLWNTKEIDGEQRMQNTLFVKDRRATTSKENGEKGGRPIECPKPSPEPTLVFKNDGCPEPSPKAPPARARAALLCSDLFLGFWTSYPRREAKPRALRAWEAVNPDSDLAAKIVADVERRKSSDQWRKENGEYIPLPATYLNQKRWEDERDTLAPVASKNGHKTAPLPPRPEFNQQYEQDMGDLVAQIKAGGK